MIDSTCKNAKILIVDDQQANIDILAGLLDALGYTNVKTITDSRLLLNLFNSYEPDLILLDLLMPHLSGFDVMEQLKTVIPAGTYLPVLVLTADMTVETKRRALAAGAKDFLVKPFDLVETGLRIKILLEARYLHQQLENQNQILEQKVQQRTIEIDKKNIELFEAKEKAEASDRLKTAFMQNISHEVRTPLNGIIGFGSLLADQDNSEEDRIQFLSLLKASSNRLVNTITDYMDIALLVSGSMEVTIKAVNLVKVLSEINSKFSTLCNIKNINLNILHHQDGGEFEIQTDPELIQKVVSHLVDNAIKFTQNGSITVGYRVDPEKIEIYVKDTGIGIEQDSRERIFESFMQENVSSTRGHEGSGLGLSIIKGMLNLLGGEIRLESVKGEGSTFFVSLPVEPGITDHAESYKSFTKKALSGLPVILIADDESTHRIYLDSFLKKHTSLIFQARNGREAVDLCREHPEIQLVMMDIKMPVLGGLEATREIKSFRKDILIIAFTAYAMNSDRKAALDAGCDDYIAKPTDSDGLLDILKKHGFANDAYLPG